MTHIMMPTLFIHPERREEFVRLIVAEIEHSMRVEPGILRFDLAADQGDPNAIHVYAVYEDAAAYAFHQEQTHYKELMEAILPMFSKPPVIRVATNVLPRDADWAALAAARRARPTGRTPKTKASSTRKSKASRARKTVSSRAHRPSRKK